MGRHSAVDDDDEIEAAVVVESPARVERRGRHAHAEAGEDPWPVNGSAVPSLAQRAAVQDDQPTDRLGLDDMLLAPYPGRSSAAATDALPTGPPPAHNVPVEAAPTDATEPIAIAEPPATSQAPVGRRPRGSQSTAADLALLRRHPDVRNRVVAAVLVPFVLYVAVMLPVGAAGGQYLLWVWIPLVTAGVGAGLILDTAHRKHPPDDTGSAG